jgi:hypothetical protein
LKSKKISYEDVAESNLNPFQYQHRYCCHFISKHGNGDVEYVMHCDHRDPRSAKAVSELKRRLSWTYTGCRLERFRVIGSKKVSSGYLYEIKRSKYEVN